MPEQLFEDLPILAELGQSFRDGMARAEQAAAPTVSSPARRRLRGRFGWLGSFLVLGLVGTAAAAGTLTLLRGSPIPGPKAEDTQAAMVQTATSLKVLSLRAADPDGAGKLPFALRVGKSAGGQICATVGQADGDDFGIVGDDGRFRELPAGIVDGCGTATDRDAAVVGARVLDASRYHDVRTVIYGAGAKNLRSAVVVVRGRAMPLPIKDGAFIGVVAHYPEDLGLQLRLRIGDHTVVRSFGTGPMLLLDPTGPAWQLSRGGGGIEHGWQTDCVNVTQVRRQPGKGFSSTPLACYRGRPRPHKVLEPPVPVIYDVRTFHRGDRARHTNPADPRGGWAWHTSARTVVWGMLDPGRVRRIDLVSSAGRQPLRRTINDSFGAVLPASVPSSEVRLVVTMRDGSIRTYSHPVVPSTSMHVGAR